VKEENETLQDFEKIMGFSSSDRNDSSAKRYFILALLVKTGRFLVSLMR